MGTSSVTRRRRFSHDAFPRAEIIVYGHTHTPVLELVDKTVTVMNPGSAGLEAL